LLSRSCRRAGENLAHGWSVATLRDSMSCYPWTAVSPNSVRRLGTPCKTGTRTRADCCDASTRILFQHARRVLCCQRAMAFSLRSAARRNDGGYSEFQWLLEGHSRIRDSRRRKEAGLLRVLDSCEGSRRAERSSRSVARDLSDSDETGLRPSL